MKKQKHVCPFSKQSCRECPIFRGRHIRLCFYRKNADTACESPVDTWEPGRGTRWELPEIPSNTTWIVLDHFAEADAHHDKRSAV